jgi:hypothetical protein
MQTLPTKKISQYSLRVLKKPSPVPNTLQGFSIDPWEISTPPKGSIKTLPPFHFVFPPFFSNYTSPKGSLQTFSIILQCILRVLENLDKKCSLKRLII